MCDCSSNNCATHGFWRERSQQSHQYWVYRPWKSKQNHNAVKSKEDPIEPVEVGHRTATICHLGNIAMKLKRKIQSDPAAERIIGDDEAAAMLSKPMLKPWTI